MYTNQFYNILYTNPLEIEEWSYLELIIALLKKKYIYVYSILFNFQCFYLFTIIRIHTQHDSIVNMFSIFA